MNIIWKDIKAKTEIYFTKLDSNGEELIDPKILLETDPNFRISIDIDLFDHIHLVLETARIFNITTTRSRLSYGYGVYYMQFNNKGNILSAPIWLSYPVESGREGSPSIAVDSIGNIHVVWKTEPSYGISYRYRPAFDVNIKISNLSDKTDFYYNVTTGKNLYINFSIENLGDQNDIINIFIDYVPNGFIVNLSENNLSLNSEELKNITFMIQIPEKLNPNLKENISIEINATSKNDININDMVLIHLKINPKENGFEKDQNLNEESDNLQFILIIILPLIIIVLLVGFIIYYKKYKKK